MRICAHSVSILCAHSPTSVEVLGFFLLLHKLLYRPNSSPLLTDIGAHSSPTFTDPHRPSPPFTDVGVHPQRSDIKFLTDDHSIPHRPNSSPLLTDVGTHSSPTFTDLHRSSPPLRTAISFGAHTHHHYIWCACAPPLRTDLHRPSPPFTDLYRLSQTFTAIAHRQSVRILCAFLTDVCGSFTPCRYSSSQNANRCAPLVHPPVSI